MQKPSPGFSLPPRPLPGLVSYLWVPGRRPLVSPRALGGPGEVHSAECQDGGVVGCWASEGAILNGWCLTWQGQEQFAQSVV